jgi:hypothetical protein
MLQKVIKTYKKNKTFVKAIVTNWQKLKKIQQPHKNQVNKQFKKQVNQKTSQKNKNESKNKSIMQWRWPLSPSTG